MKPIVIYTKSYCPYCHAAKELLRRKGWTFTEIDVTTDAEGQQEMSRRAGGRTTVPQIFIGDTHVGGCDDLYALEEAGRLDPLMAA
ncbi:glutaredoxin 3 [Xanthobacter tagetidis]|jgi:glutaredoxin 3|uniref:Glutaredoxin n=1 Tax=Xanthobacter tagetidis TaxID=60216 RepID=A0A3L7ANE2_9HYPH|nr:glutaredoxin 3 [Xanthobacter tagetidis]MBB6308257.1 glutaredoxin 3 [Xanthobacter tagetidis]RLP81867.1 glutaredoxin 3 [Xanthobacter tagetidis]